MFLLVSISLFVNTLTCVRDNKLYLGKININLQGKVMQQYLILHISYDTLPCKHQNVTFYLTQAMT